MLHLTACDNRAPILNLPADQEDEEPEVASGEKADRLLSGLFPPVPLHVFPETVSDALGEPAAFGIGDAPLGTAYYDDGPYAGLEVLFADYRVRDPTTGDLSLGYCAVWHDVMAPYARQTLERWPWQSTETGAGSAPLRRSNQGILLFPPPALWENVLP